MAETGRPGGADDTARNMADSGGAGAAAAPAAADAATTPSAAAAAAPAPTASVIKPPPPLRVVHPPAESPVACASCGAHLAQAADLLSSVRWRWGARRGVWP